MIKDKRDSQRIYFRYQHIVTYFAPRERQCMALLLQGKTAREIAKHLNLSTRTVEFYFFNMRNKLAARTKKELIQRVLETDFLNQMHSFSIDPSMMASNMSIKSE